MTTLHYEVSDKVREELLDLTNWGSGDPLRGSDLAHMFRHAYILTPTVGTLSKHERLSDKGRLFYLWPESSETMSFGFGSHLWWRRGVGNKEEDRFHVKAILDTHTWTLRKCRGLIP